MVVLRNCIKPGISMHLQVLIKITQASYDLFSPGVARPTLVGGIGHFNLNK